MSSHEAPNDTPATPEQAHELYVAIRSLTTLHGSNYGDRNSVSGDLLVVPSAIAEHLPPEESTSDISYSINFTDIFGRQLHPSKGHVISMVSVTQNQMPASTITYAAHANYHIVTLDNSDLLGIERHVTNTEHGPRMLTDFDTMSIDDLDTYSQSNPEKLAASMHELLDSLTEVRNRVRQTRPLEASLGMFTVSQLEAQELIGLTKDAI